jgi:predicted nuclease with TOPRIM domain
MKKPKLKDQSPSTKAIFDALFERMMTIATANGQLIERNKNLREQVEKLTKENAELKEACYRETPSTKKGSTLEIKGFWSNEDRREVVGEKAE